MATLFWASPDKSCVVQELLELEFQLDEPSRARQQQWQHLAWRKLVEAGVAYRDLFRVRLTRQVSLLMHIFR